jgi:hypothetical protein
VAHRNCLCADSTTLLLQSLPPARRPTGHETRKRGCPSFAFFGKGGYHESRTGSRISDPLPRTQRIEGHPAPDVDGSSTLNLSPSETAGPSTTLRFGRDDNSVAVAGLALSGEILDLKRICHPDRSVPGFPATWYSPTATCAAFREESRRKFDDATKLDRKSGGA